MRHWITSFQLLSAECVRAERFRASETLHICWSDLLLARARPAVVPLIATEKSLFCGHCHLQRLGQIPQKLRTLRHGFPAIGIFDRAKPPDLIRKTSLALRQSAGFRESASPESSVHRQRIA